eukprot:CAMPEP_0113946002 /NCGR_PEP_ID=MMETSP1339-20121228/53694_1 /TAXON_ID=94617 /ORGANISM="Fibrocapsa japonica" /LENGTH=98 /DNA_ID=CAMNT_0000951875 /DNA_START=54 /DNA_END=350 /DNA_ORIENTATION=- /assembly_acc=CAM_ASM_000762
MMQGAGRDCTDLFNKYHPWVNGESMMQSLLLGYIVEGGKASESCDESNSRDTSDEDDQENDKPRDKAPSRTDEHEQDETEEGTSTSQTNQNDGSCKPS